MQESQIDEGLPSGAIPALDQLVCQLDLAKATEAARVGHYQEAEAFLADIPGRDQNPFALDLLARMRAQQGRLAEAELCWKKALEIDPTNPEYQAGIAYVTRAQRRVGWNRLSWTTLFLWLVGIVGLVFLGLVLSNLSSLQQGLVSLSTTVDALPVRASIPTPVVSTPAAPDYVTQTDLEKLGEGIKNQIDASQAGQDKINAQMTTLQADQQAWLADLQSTPLPPDVKMDVPGVRVTFQGNILILVFEQGLFRYNWSLDPAMEETLAQVGQKLKDLGNNIQITLIGFRAKDEDPAIDSSGHKLSDIYLDLGQVRAQVVLNFLQSRALIPAEIFRMRSQDTLAAPFPNDTLENQDRNRTVIFWITRKN